MSADSARSWSAVEKSAAHIIGRSLVLKAWRRKKEENNTLKYSMKNLSDKVDALQLQKYALRQLLDAEKIRLAMMNNDVHKIINALEVCRQEKNLLLKDNEKLQDRIKDLEDRCSGMENEQRNQTNDLLTAKLEARNWERQLEKEREKLLKMKSERKLSVEEVQELPDTSKEFGGINNRKAQRDSRVKSTTCRNSKKNTSRGRDVGKVDFGKN